MSLLGFRRAAGALVVIAVAAMAWRVLAHAQEAAVAVPVPALDPRDDGTTATAVFAGGCFWGVQGVYQHVKGVTQALSGYAGGTKANPTYEEVSEGDTGHAESVRVIFDPRQVSYGQLLSVFFSVAHNPTELNYQGPDEGTNYRSDIFYLTADQQKTAAAYIAQLGAGKVFKDPIVTRVDPLVAFYPAEAYHQDFLTLHPTYPYIVINDLPKIANLKRMFPDLYREAPVLVGG